MLDYRELDENSKHGLERMMAMEGTYTEHFEAVKEGKTCVGCLKPRDKCSCSKDDE